MTDILLSTDMLLSIIVAVSQNGVIGQGQRLPWHLPADLRYFKANTVGKIILMGRKTFESIGRPLPQRENIVITRTQAVWPGAHVTHSLKQALQCARALKAQSPDLGAEIMVIGGAELYRQALPLASQLYLTQVQTVATGDIIFPTWDSSQWQEIQRENHKADDKNPYNYSFVIFERKQTIKLATNDRLNNVQEMV